VSQKLYGHIRPSFQEAYLEEKVGELVSRALREEHEREASPMKQISKKTSIAPDSVKRWYTSKKPPSLGHFLMLVQNYPEILKAFLGMVGHGYLAAHVGPVLGMVGHGYLAAHVGPVAVANNEGETLPSVAVFRDISDIPNVPKNPLNERQAWFLIRLQRTGEARAEDIAAHFKVAIKTARRDIEGLKMTGKVRFIGSKRMGAYEIINKYDTK